MARNQTFLFTPKQPFANDASVSAVQNGIHGPVSWLNPTQARFKRDTPAAATPSTSTSEHEPELKPVPGIEYQWRSRDNRKGRHMLRVDLNQKDKMGNVAIPESSRSPRKILKNIGRMFTYFPYWDVSFLSAFLFTWGSAVFVIDGFFVWLPLVAPRSEFSTEILYGGGIAAFIGTVIFQFGAIFVMLEAVNENRTGCFGWALERLVTKAGDHEQENGAIPRLKLVPQPSHCQHNHSNKTSLLQPRKDVSWHDHQNTNASTSKRIENDRKFTWWPSWYELKHHYFHELGFLSSFILFISATIFWIIGFTGLPGIFNHLSVNLAYGVYWAPDLVGSVGFVISSYLYLLETQQNWYTPAFGVIGWHIGFWNTVGSFGFAISAALGYCSFNSRCVYQSSLASLWGSIAFLIGSTLQWYESLDKYPVEHVQRKDESK